MPTISVVIPTYNRAGLLPEAITSALGQSSAPLEVIVVDDGSQDGTAGVVARFGSAVRYVSQPNAGVGVARNTGAGRATGDWVAFLDSDDIWEREKLALQLAALRAAPDTAWSLTDLTVVDGEGRPRGDPAWSPNVFGCLQEMGTTARELFANHLARLEVDWAGKRVEVFAGDLYPLLFHGNLGLPSSLMVRRDVFQQSGGFDPAFRIAEETEYLHRLSARWPAALLMAPLVRYRVAHGPSLINTGDPRPAIRNALRSLSQASRLRAPLDATAEAARVEGETRLRFRLARAALSAGDPAEARAALAELPAARWSLRRAAYTGLSLLPAPVLQEERARCMAEHPVTRTIALMIESDGPGGAERVVIELAEELRRRGFGVCPVGPERGSGWLAGQFRVRGFEPEGFRLNRAVDPACAFDLKRTLVRRGVSVIHSHEFTMAVYGTAVARLLQVPHVITMHGGRGYQAAWRRRMALRWACRRSAAVGVSRASARELERSLGLAAGEVQVVPNGIRFVPGDRARGRAALGLEASTPLMLAVGNLYPVKGHIHLLEALRQLAAMHPELQWRAAIAGRGEEEPALRTFLAASALSGRVTLLGYRDDVADLLAAADVYAMPSLSEGMPLALVEAMFAGCPIVASRVGGIPDVVREGEEALLVAPEDSASLAEALADLLGNPARREALAGAALARAKSEFDVGRMADAYERLYRG